MKSARNLSVVALAIAAVSGSVQAQTVPPAGKAYVFHSPAQYRCPGLDWLLVAGENGTITGMVGWDDMKSVAKAQGSIQQNGQVQMTALDNQGRTATITGAVNSDGGLVLNITTPNAKCEGINVPLFVTPS